MYYWYIWGKPLSFEECPPVFTTPGESVSVTDDKAEELGALLEQRASLAVLAKRSTDTSAPIASSRALLGQAPKQGGGRARPSSKYLTAPAGLQSGSRAAAKCAYLTNATAKDLKISAVSLGKGAFGAVFKGMFLGETSVTLRGFMPFS